MPYGPDNPPINYKIPAVNIFNYILGLQNGPGSNPGQGTALCFWAGHLTLIVPLSTQVYKWVPANLLLGGNPAMD